ncbi:MAG TPA: lysophospholipase [Acidimicrobiia bacterium]|nr:lysophospholipase [Acidimicrobiia bacterium]
MTVTHRTASDGTEIFSREWSPDGEARSSIVMVHGLAEHSGRYLHVGESLARRGHHVRASDLRGFGRSSGRRAWVERWDDYLDDLEDDMDAARRFGVPVTLLGHSLGGLVAISYALSDRPAADLLVLSAPGLDADLPAYKKAMARILGAILPRISVANGLEGHHLSRDPLVGEAYFSDDLVHTRTTLRLGREGLLAGDRARGRLDELAVPTLVIHGSHDPIVPPAISRPLETLEVVDRLELQGHRHESFNEEGGVEAIDTVAAWIERRL